MRSSSGGQVERPASGLSCSSTGGVTVAAMSSVGMAGKRKARYRQQNYRPMKWKRKRTAQFKLEWKPRAQGDGMSCLRHAARTRQLESDGWAYSCAIAGGRAGVTLASRVVWDGDKRRTPPAAAHRPASRPRDTLTSILDGRCAQQAPPCTLATACRWLSPS